MRSTWRVIIKGALLSGLAGPGIAAGLSIGSGIVLWLAGGTDARVDRPLSGFLVGAGLVWMYATWFAGPIAALLGALGTWLVLQAHRCVSRRVLWAIGVGVGALLGALCPWLSIDIVSSDWPPRLADPRNPYTVLGGAVGAIVGSLVTLLVIRSAPSRSSR